MDLLMNLFFCDLDFMKQGRNKSGLGLLGSRFLLKLDSSYITISIQ